MPYDSLVSGGLRMLMFDQFRRFLIVWEIERRVFGLSLRGLTVIDRAGFGSWRVVSCSGEMAMTTLCA